MTRNNSILATAATFIASWLLLAPYTVSAQQASAQQTGTITGRIVELSTGEPVIGATVVVVGTKFGARTSVDGSYTIRNLPQGSYNLKFSSVGYGAKTIEGIAVGPGNTVRQDATLATTAVQGKEIVVSGRKTLTSESALLAQQRKSAVVSDGITSETVKRTSDKNAGESDKRVTGVSVVDGKYVFVRGLGERYSNTQLNGVSISSPEPEKKVVPFDIFPAGMLENIIVSKTFSPDQPGTSSGGLIQIQTKEFPEHLQGAVSLSTGFNTQTQFKSAPVYSGGGLDFLGFDNGVRTLPDFPAGTQKPTPLTSAEYNASIAAKFSNIWSPQLRTLPMNYGFSLSLGDETTLAEDVPLGYIASLTYASDWSHRIEEDRFPLPSESGRGFAYDLTSEKSIYSVNWGALLNLSTKLGVTDKISLKSIYNRSAEDETRLLSGADVLFGDSRSTRLRYVERALLSSALSGEHFLEGLGGATVNWKASFSEARRNEPDNREALQVRSATSGELQVAQRQSRFFSEMVDREGNAAADLVLPLQIAADATTRIKFGAFYSNKVREFDAHRYGYTPGDNYGTSDFTVVEDFTSPESIASDITEFQDLTRGSDSYTASERNASGYGMFDLLFGNWRFVGGARLESNQIHIASATGSAPPYAPLAQDLNTIDLLPSLNLIYSLTEAMNLRLGYGSTVARPELRELAPFRFDDYRRSTYGNPYLEETEVRNYDLRWEWFPRAGEMLSVSLFYKSFDKPIENILLPDPTTTADVRPIGTANSKNAYVMGTELEVRHSLDMITDALAPLSLGVNVTALKSEITQGDSVVLYVGSRSVVSTANQALVTNLVRPLQGQSPYVVNINLSYDNPESGTAMTLLYNVAGPRLKTVGTTGFDDIYEQARNQVDVTASQILFGSWQVKLSARNLLDADYAFKLGDTYTSRYKIGRSFSLGLSYAL
jgi:hypothetical protein